MKLEIRRYDKQVYFKAEGRSPGFVLLDGFERMPVKTVLHKFLDVVQ